MNKIIKNIFKCALIGTLIGFPLGVITEWQTNWITNSIKKQKHSDKCNITIIYDNVEFNLNLHDVEYIKKDSTGDWVNFGNISINDEWLYNYFNTWYWHQDRDCNE